MRGWLLAARRRHRLLRLQLPHRPRHGLFPSKMNPDVRQETIQQGICVPGYIASVRPSTTYTNGVKTKLLREQGLPATDSQRFELDHRVPLALGGHPRVLANLQLQVWEGPRGAKAKDVIERRLQMQVCAGRLLLVDAQRTMYFDWAGD